MRKPKCTHCASIWLSKTKSSEFSAKANGKDLPAERAITGVVFRKLDPQEEVLERCQQSVGNVFVERHAAAQRGSPDDARTQHDVIYAVCHHAGHRCD